MYAQNGLEVSFPLGIGYRKMYENISNLPMYLLTKYLWLLLHKDHDVWDTISMVHELSMMYIFILVVFYMNTTSTLSHFTVDLCRFLKSLSSRNYLLVLFISIFMLNSSQLTNYGKQTEKNWLLCCLHLILFTRMNKTEFSIYHLVS